MLILFEELFVLEKASMNLFSQTKVLWELDLVHFFCTKASD